MRLQIRATEIDIDSGKLFSNNSNNTSIYLLNYSNYPDDNPINKNCRMHPLQLLSAPEDYLQQSRAHGNYVFFGHSDIYTDSGQTTLPLWDAQPVAPEPAVPLKGLGFIWKNVDRSGGFVAPVVLPFDYESNFVDLQPALMEQLLSKYKTKWENVTIEC